MCMWCVLFCERSVVLSGSAGGDGHKISVECKIWKLDNFFFLRLIKKKVTHSNE